MNKKTAIVVGSAVCLGVLLLAVGMANASPAKKKEDEADEGIEVTPPGPEGVPVEHEDAPTIKVLPPKDDIAPNLISPPDITTSGEEIKAGGGDKTSTEKILEEADKNKKSDAEIVKSIVEDLAPGAEPAPITKAETSKELDPYGTVGLAHKLILAETMDNWKSMLGPDVETWQRKVGLNPDGKFGPDSGAKMAEEVGVLPLVRYWPLGKVWDKASAQAYYKPKINAVIEKLKKDLPDSQAHIMALNESLSREVGQSLAKTPAKQPSLEFATDVEEKAAKLGETQGLKEIA